MAFTDEDRAAMDNAAKQAKEEFLEHLDSWSAKDLVDWWSRWYGKAGHKRLGRILVAITRQSS